MAELIRSVMFTKENTKDLTDDEIAIRNFELMDYLGNLPVGSAEYMESAKEFHAVVRNGDAARNRF